MSKNTKNTKNTKKEMVCDMTSEELNSILSHFSQAIELLTAQMSQLQKEVKQWRDDDDSSDETSSNSQSDDDENEDDSGDYDDEEEDSDEEPMELCDYCDQPVGDCLSDCPENE